MISDAVLVAVTVLTLFLPGAAAGWSLGLRPWQVAAGAPALTFGLVTAAGTVASVVEFPWNPATFAVGTAVLCALVILTRWFWLRRSGQDGRLFPALRRPCGPDIAIAAGVALGALISAVTLLRGFGSLGNPSQDWDYGFHANAIRLISDRGDIAPAALRAINDWESRTSFYPNAFHGLGAIVRDLTGAPVIAVLNAETLTICAVAGLGLAVLLRALGCPTAVSASTPVLLAGFASFPYDLIWRGPVLPYAMGVALLPGFFVLVLDALATRRVAVSLSGGLAAASLLGVQPSVGVSAALIALPLLVQRWVPRSRKVLADVGCLLILSTSALVLALPYITRSVGSSAAGVAMQWPAVETFGQAVGDLVLLDHGTPAPQYWLAGLLVVGLLVIANLRSLWWWLAGGAVAVLQFALVASSDSQRVHTLTGPWWNDRYRFAALAVLAFAPLAAAGLYSLARVAARVAAPLTDRLLAGPARWRGSLVAPLAALGLLAVAVLSHGLYTHPNQARVATAYQSRGFLDDTEVAAMRWLARQPDAHEGMVMNDPTDGSQYMWALDGLRPAFGHIMTVDTAGGPEQRLLLARFHCIDSNPTIRRAVRQLGIHYVFVSGGYIRADMTRVVGLRGLSGVQSLHEVYSQGEVQIYRVSLTPEPTRPDAECTSPSKP